MPGRAGLARIDDMLVAIATICEIDEHGAALPRSVARLALERAFEIISEASRHLPEDLKATEPAIGWKKIAGIGNVLRHDYQSVDHQILNDTSTFDIPPLKDALLRMRTRLRN